MPISVARCLALSDRAVDNSRLVRIFSVEGEETCRVVGTVSGPGVVYSGFGFDDGFRRFFMLVTQVQMTLLSSRCLHDTTGGV